MTAPSSAHRRPAARRVPRERGRAVRVRAPGGGEPPPDRRARRLADPVRHHARRAGRRVHGRHLRRADRQGGRLHGDAGPGGDQPAARRGRRAARLASARGDHRAGGPRSPLQGVASGRRPRVPVPARDEMGRHGDAARRRARDGAEGVQAGRDRAAGRHVPDPARGRRRTPDRRGAAPGERPARSGAVGGPGASGDPRARRGGAPGRARRGRRGARRRDGRARSLQRTPQPPGRHDVPRQGRVPRRPPERARHDRVHGEGLRELRVRPGRRRGGGRVRPRRVRAFPLEPGAGQADHPRPPDRGGGRRALHARGGPAGLDRADARRRSPPPRRSTR